MEEGKKVRKKNNGNSGGSNGPVSFPVVAIGASAGGLEAVSELLKHLPANTGMAFFYVQHLSPTHSSVLASLLARVSPMKVHEAKHMMEIEPDHIYVCTPNKEIVPKGNKIMLRARNSAELPYMPIDDFFTMMAHEYKGKITGVILSGNATDGTDGLSAIKENGGITFAQDKSAKNKSMPASAVKAGVVDYVLSPEKIAMELIHPGKNGNTRYAIKSRPVKQDINDTDVIKKLLALLHKERGMDFLHYKASTIKRRVQHRMRQHHIETLSEYIGFVNGNDEEIGKLYGDLFIHVTCFFREKETFRFLKRVVIPRLLKNHRDGEELRLWIPGCSTGEEAYSFAMIICELQDNKENKVPVKIFATDISEQAIGIARMGEYAAGSMKGVSPAQVKRFFTASGNLYRVKKEIRDICVFATHNILSDPPFSHISLLSCCNLLIYLDAHAQKNALATFYFALADHGYLMLGKSETTSTMASNFNQLDNKYKVYQRSNSRNARKAPVLEPAVRRSLKTNAPGMPVKPKKETVVSEADMAINTILLENYMPACAVINKELDILQFRGSTSIYLEHTSGTASLNIMKLIRPELMYGLRMAINQALSSQEEVSKKSLEITVNKVTQPVSVDIRPLPGKLDEPLLLIIFTPDIQAAQQANDAPAATQAQQLRTQNLKNEIKVMRNEVNQLIENHQAINEALQAANEEIVSSNEEFQTLNEELETSKEEIEAANEELISTNQELSMRNEMLAESYQYAEAIISTIHEPMLILRSDLTVRSANASFYKKFKVRKENTEGNSVFSLGNGQWDIPQLRSRLNQLLSNGIGFHDFEVTHVFNEIGERVMLLNANLIERKSAQEQLVLFAIEDVTELARQQFSEKEALRNDISLSRGQNEVLEKAVQSRTKETEQALAGLEKKNAELVKANKDLTTLTYISTHDLQEPLRKIQVFASCILNEKEQKLSARAKEYFNRMQQTSMRMQLLLKDLTTYSRVKDSNPVFERADLNGIVKKAKNELKDFINTKEATIISDRLGEADVIPSQFTMLFHNLLSNALKFSHPLRRPVITITRETAKADGLQVPGLIDGEMYCHIQFSDNGIGFDPEYKDQIFDVFKKLHGADDFEGTGIGLAICKRVVEYHHGVITAHGKLNEGAVFDIYIPAL
jgi:two-component system CheB/CheR fusion protein